MGRQVDESKKELAFILYMTGEQQKVIAERVGTTPKTIGEWAEKGSWKEKRSAKTITRTELVNKVLNNISEILDAGDITGSADQLSKLAVVIERLDKKSNPVVVMEVFTNFMKYITAISDDKALNIEFIKSVNRYQDKYINTLIAQQ